MVNLVLEFILFYYKFLETLLELFLRWYVHLGPRGGVFIGNLNDVRGSLWI